MKDLIVHIHELHHIYPDKTEVHLKGEEFQVHAGERVVILGPNGSGKTTLLRHLMGLLEPCGGQCHVFGLDPKRDFARLIRRIGVVFQNVDDQIIGPTVWDDVAFSPRNHGLPEDEVRRLTERAMQVVGISHLAERVPHYLSGGEKKKVALAGALALQPELLILDEPFDALDPRSKSDLLALLRRLNEELGTAMVITTHDVNLVNSIAHTVYVVSRGHVLARGEPLEIFMEAGILEQANLEAPALAQLFFELHKQGVHLEPPLGVPDAAAQLVGLLAGLGYSFARPRRRAATAAAVEGESALDD